MGLNLTSVVDAAAQAWPDRVALIDPEGQWTYPDLARAVRSAAGQLHEAGVRPGHRVPLIDVPSPLVLATVLAALRMGAAAAPMNPRLTAAETRTLCELADAGKVAVTAEGFRDRLAHGDRIVLGEEILSTDSDHVAAPGAEAVVLFTSGTTGLPKPVPVPWTTLHDRLAGYTDPASTQVRMLCVPTHHVGGLIGALVSVVGGHTLVLQPRFDAGEWLRLVALHGVQLTFMVPTMLSRILDHPALATTDLSSLKTVTYGASPMSDDLVSRLTQAMPGVGFVNTFGQTETLGGITLSTPADALHPVRRTSVGKVLSGVEIRIVAPGTDTAVDPGGVGELLVRSGQNVAAGWLRTGDLVCQDSDGYLYPQGRLSDTINRGGEKFGPIEVETALREHPAVVDCAVAGVPDVELGERVGAAVVASRSITALELKQWCASRIAAYKGPELVTFVDEIPLTDMGKVDRLAVVRLMREG